MKEKIEVLITEEELQTRIKQIASEISKDSQGKDLTLICVLKGGVMFMVDLSKNLQNTVELEFMEISSYGNSTETSGKINILKDIRNDITGKHILLVEDIVDTGNTLSYLISYLKSKNPSSLKICTLLDKPDRRIVDVYVDYIGFTIPDSFVVGYGLDYAQRYRNLPYIGILNFEN